MFARDTKGRQTSEVSCVLHGMSTRCVVKHSGNEKQQVTGGRCTNGRIGPT